MKQYCRYCTNAIMQDTDLIYCEAKGTMKSGSAAKTENHCRKFDFNEIDAFDLDKTYHPRKPKQEQCDGQMSLFR